MNRIRKPPSKGRTYTKVAAPGTPYETRRPATEWSAISENVPRIFTENPRLASPSTMRDITQQLRRELTEKGLKGFKKGGPVKKTGVYKLHKGERVVPAKRGSPRKR